MGVLKTADAFGGGSQPFCDRVLVQLHRALTALPGFGAWTLPKSLEDAKDAEVAKLLRTCSAPTQPVVSAAEKPDAAAKSEIQEEVCEGLEEFLRVRGLLPHLLAAEAWCCENGAAFLEEVLEHKRELADSLGLQGTERQRLLGTTAATRQRPVVRLLQGPSPAGLLRGTALPGPAQAPPPLSRAASLPLRAQELARAQERVEKAYVPLKAWRRRAAAPAERAWARSSSRSASPAVSSTAWPELPGPELPPRTARQKFREENESLAYRSLSWTRRRITDGETLHAMRQRIPTPAELGALAEAQKRLEQEKEGSQCSQGKRQGPDLHSGQIGSLAELRQCFLSEYGRKIQDELNGATLTPAEIAPHVGERFLKSCTDNVTVQAAYHGTREYNYPSILRQGLCVPGHNGVTVRNGSAHGVGIYTAVLGASYLSKGFADSDSLLVCAVADNNKKPDNEMEKPAGKAAKKAAKKANAQPRWTGGGLGGSRFHRNHQPASKPITQAAVGISPVMMGNLTLHKETEAVRHVGNAMVIFEDERVAPLFVAEGIGNGNCRTRKNVDLWPAHGNPNMKWKGKVPGGGLHIASRQAKVGDERLWLPPEAMNYRHGKLVRRRWNEKARDVLRRAHRDCKAAGLVHA